MMDVIATVRAVKPDFIVLSGDDSLALPLLSVGGDGVISVVSNIGPAEVTAMVTSALTGDFAKARELHYRLLPAFRNAFIETRSRPDQGCHEYERLVPAGTLRLPMCKLLKENEGKVRSAFEEAGPARKERRRFGQFLLIIC